MQSFGLTSQEVIDILKNKGGLSEGQVASAVKLREAIASVIEENNKKLLEDVRRMIDENALLG